MRPFGPPWPIADPMEANPDSRSMNILIKLCFSGEMLSLREIFEARDRSAWRSKAAHRMSMASKQPLDSRGAGRPRLSTAGY